MAQITHTQVRSVLPTGKYRVADTVTASAGIEKEVFLFLTDGDQFSHVATAAEMSLYPNTRAAALAGNKPFYRAVAVTEDWSSVVLAQEFADTLKARLKLLLVTYVEMTGEFVGTDTNVVVTS